MSISLATTLALWLLSGLAGGTCHFAMLRWNTPSICPAAGMLRALAVQVLRMAATAGCCSSPSRTARSPCWLAAIGVLLARALILRVTAGAP